MDDPGNDLLLQSFQVLVRGIAGATEKRTRKRKDFPNPHSPDYAGFILHRLYWELVGVDFDTTDFKNLDRDTAYVAARQLPERIRAISETDEAKAWLACAVRCALGVFHGADRSRDQLAEFVRVGLMALEEHRRTAMEARGRRAGHWSADKRTNPTAKRQRQVEAAELDKLICELMAKSGLTRTASAGFVAKRRGLNCSGRALLARIGRATKQSL